MAPTSLTPVQARPGIRLAALASMLALFACAPAFADTVFTVRQSFTVKDVPAGAKSVRGWFWMPEDRPEQHVMEFRVTERHSRSASRAIRATDVPGFMPKPGATSRCVVVTEIQSPSPQSQRHGGRHEGWSHDGRKTAARFPRNWRLDEKQMEVSPEIHKVANDLAAGKPTRR